MQHGGVFMDDGLNEEKAVAFSFDLENDANINTESIFLAIE